MTLRHYIRRDPVLLALLFALPAPAQAQPTVAGAADTRTASADTFLVALTPARLAAAARFVERNWSRLGLPGVAVAVATPDSVVLAVAHGRGAVDGGVLTPRTPFLIGSVTKTLTATAAAHLAHQGVLDLDAPVESYLPDFTMRPPFRPGSITLRHLLQHTSGLGQWVGHDARAQQEGAFAHLAPSRRPGERGEYSSLNFIILGRVLEEVSGRPYPDLLEEVLFRPLGMTSAFVDGPVVETPTAGTPGRGRGRPATLARGHRSWFGFQRRATEPPPPRYLVPAGFAGASAHDLAVYGGMLVGGGAFAGRDVLDERTVAELLGPVDSAGRALAWGRRRVEGRLLVEHAGNARTFAARMRLVPQDRYAIVVLTNTNAGPFFDAPVALLEGVDGILQGRPVSDPWPVERLFRGAVLVGTVLSVAGMARKVHGWGQAGRPVALDASRGTLGRLAFDVGLGAAVLFGVPRLVGVPLTTMLEYFPDLGVALTASAGAGVVGGLFDAFRRSAR